MRINAYFGSHLNLLTVASLNTPEHETSAVHPYEDLWAALGLLGSLRWDPVCAVCTLRHPSGYSIYQCQTLSLDYTIVGFRFG